MSLPLPLTLAITLILSPSPSPHSHPTLQRSYGVTTTSEVEYYFVVDPEGGLSRFEQLDTWPIEHKLLGGRPAGE